MRINSTLRTMLIYVGLAQAGAYPTGSALLTQQDVRLDDTAPSGSGSTTSRRNWGRACETAANMIFFSSSGAPTRTRITFFSDDMYSWQKRRQRALDARGARKSRAAPDDDAFTTGQAGTGGRSTHWSELIRLVIDHRSELAASALTCRRTFCSLNGKTLEGEHDTWRLRPHSTHGANELSLSTTTADHRSDDWSSGMDKIPVYPEYDYLIRTSCLLNGEKYYAARLAGRWWPGQVTSIHGRSFSSLA